MRETSKEVCRSGNSLTDRLILLLVAFLVSQLCRHRKNVARWLHYQGQWRSASIEDSSFDSIYRVSSSMISPQPTRKTLSWNLSFSMISSIRVCGIDLADEMLLIPILAVHNAQPGWRRVIAQAVLWGIPTPAFSTALAFFDGYKSEVLPANLLQAQVRQWT